VGERERGTDRERGQEGKDRKRVETGYKQGGGTDREEGGTDTGEVGALVAIRGAVFICGRSLSAGAHCSWVGGRRRPFAFEDGGGGRSFRAVVRGWLWWGYSSGHTMVSGGGSGRSRVGVLLFVGGVAEKLVKIREWCSLLVMMFGNVFRVQGALPNMVIYSKIVRKSEKNGG
jgi:hypothetical protein